MRRPTRWAAFAVLAALAVTLVAVFGGTAARGGGKKPIVIGAAIDLTKIMSPFDAPALAAAQIEIAKINAAGGVNGRPLQLKFINDQLDPNRTKQAALQLLSQGADIGWVTCDVDFATPAAQTFLRAKKLTVAPCLGTDELSPLRFGSLGDLAFSFGNAAQDEGSAMAEYSFKNGWHSSVVVTDNFLRYFKDICKAYTIRFKELGGKIVARESFTQGDKTIGNVVTRVNGEHADNIAFCTSYAGDQPAFVSGLRSLGNNTPIINSWAGDGAYWWTKSPPVTNYYYVTYASVYGDDPNAAVRGLISALTKAGHPPQTGGFLAGAGAIDALAAAIRIAHGSTNGATLASVIVKFHHQPTISGLISFSPQLHSVFGRQYRVIKVQNNHARVVGEVTTQKVANIH